MQAPQRKGKYTSTIKGVHAEQLSKLQHKHQQEIDLLDDIRLFSKQRAAIEKEYAQALVKLGEQFLGRRKFPPPPKLKSEDGKDYKTIWAVWKTVLEETRRVGDMRLQAADTYLQQISEPAKPLKASKLQVAKKVFDQFSTLHREVSLTVQDLTKAHKAYCEEEHIAHEARVKAEDAESKVKNKSTGLFTSLAKLQQASNKLNIRRDGCEIKSTSARNDYLLNLAAANAHSSRYYNTDLPQLIKTLDGEMYEKVQEYFTTLARSELECCGLTQECFMKILTDSCLVSREFNLQCFLHENKVYSDCIQYKYEAQDKDPITQVSTDHNAQEQIDGETRKWTSFVAKETHRLFDSQNNLKLLEQQIANGDIKMTSNHEGSKNEKGSSSSQNDPEQRLEVLKNAVRMAETNKSKGEAVLEVLRDGGIDIDSWMEKAEVQAAKEMEEERQRLSTSTSPTKATDTSLAKSVSSHTESSSRHDSQSVLHSSVGQQPSSLGNSSTYVNYEEDDYVDDAFETNTQHQAEVQSVSTGYASMTTSGKSYPLPCLALYEFKAENGDELDLSEREQLEIVADGDGDGWLRARNKSGKEGLVPENYIQMCDTFPEDGNEMNVDSDTPVYSADPVKNAISAWGDVPQKAAQHSSHYSPTKDDSQNDTIKSATSNYSATDYEVQQTVAKQPNTRDGDWVRAMYDYDATCDEELSFKEGQLIRLTRKDENGVDDGWWEGELNGKVGVFPSLVVEELNSSQKTGSCEGDAPLPPGTAPPKLDNSSETGYSNYYNGYEYDYDYYDSEAYRDYYAKYYQNNESSV